MDIGDIKGGCMVSWGLSSPGTETDGQYEINKY